ncbi:MAG: YihY family inner membrane protein [Actinobacteria bacterium]|nr:YihY family inner membrane protein [Actinomycetota bacterium]
MRVLARLAALFLAFKSYKASRDEDPAQRAHRRVTESRGRSRPPRTRSRVGSASLSRSSDRSSVTGPGEPVPPQRAGEPGPDTPLELEPEDWKATVKRSIREIKEDRVTLVAAGMAYYFFLAIFPAVIALVGVLGLVNASDATIGDIKSSIGSIMPGEAGNVLTEAIDNANGSSQQASLVATIVGIALALWSASAGFVHLQSGLNIAYDVPEDRKFVGKRLVAFALLVVTGLLGGVPSPFFTFGESAIFVAVGWVLTVGAVVVLFSIYYFVAPSRANPTWHWVSPGGLLGALLWIVASLGFKLYAGNSESYSETYGSIAGVVVLILWLYITSLSILIGGELNAELEHQASRRPMRPRPA